MQFQHTDLSELDELTEENLDFSALSDGLGFHPKQKFQVPTSRDEAPKAPPSGATLAGPIRVSPAVTAPRSTAAAAKPAPHAQPEKALWLEPAANPALRLLAFAADLAFVTIPLALACKFSFTPHQFLNLLRGDWKSFFGLYAAILAVYFLLSESFGGQSLGKILFGLRIVEDDKYEKPIGFWRALARIPLLLLGIVSFGFGIFSLFADRKHRPWHDKFTSSIVRKA